MIRSAAYLVVALACGGAVGWVTASLPPEAVRARDGVARDAAALSPLRHPGVAIGAARERLDALGPAPPPVEAPSVETLAVASPPPPDIAVRFRRDLTAIEETSRGPVVWIVDTAEGSSRRAIRTGGLYKDGWRVATITPQSIELRRRAETRRVPAFSPPEIDAAP